ncbi:MAG: glycosyltransferase family 2 protein [Chloroflexi bacterium]|nr:glycosyltransferase family 2 protein [Chloroflexota bacterium]
MNANAALQMTKSMLAEKRVEQTVSVIGSTAPSAPGTDVEISIVMPCLNEIETIVACVRKAKAVIATHGYRGEVVVSDNGSTDGSVEAALAAGARVVHQPLRGYGNAYIKGFESAEGRFILMADSDNTYDLNDLPQFLALLRDGYDVVMGNRFTGNILPGAMPWSHRYIGNPALSGLLNLFFKSGVGDAHCGMRAFSREAYKRMHLQTGGMEFASEMVINSAKAGLKMTEVPITYYPRLGESKLNSFRDGWRHLRFMLLYSPTHLYLWPGTAMMLVGLAALLGLAAGPVKAFGLTFGIHWMFVGSLLALLGFQLINLGFFARMYSLSSHIDVTRDGAVTFFTRHFRMESGLFIGLVLFSIGIVTFLFVLGTWAQHKLDVTHSIRLSILALTLSVLGAQTVFSSFFISMMVIKRSGWQ